MAAMRRTLSTAYSSWTESALKADVLHEAPGSEAWEYVRGEYLVVPSFVGGCVHHSLSRGRPVGSQARSVSKGRLLPPQGPSRLRNDVAGGPPP